MRKVDESNTPTGKKNAFEKFVTHLIPKDHIIKKRIITAKRLAAQISEVDISNGARTGIGLASVHFRYYIPEELRDVTQA